MYAVECQRELWTCTRKQQTKHRQIESPKDNRWLASYNDNLTVFQKFN